MATRLGTPGRDFINGTSAADRLFGLGGNDRLFGLGGNDLVDGGTGNDLLRGNAGNDRVSGASGNDTLFGDGGNDLLSGGTGNDRLFGGLGTDTLFGGSGNDVITSDAADRVNGGTGFDTQIVFVNNTPTQQFFVTAGSGIETLFVRSYVLSPGGGADGSAVGGNALDNLIVDQGPGNIIMSGNGGSDTLIGGNGPNIFLFSGSAVADGRDVVDGNGGFDLMVFEFADDAAAVNFRTGTVSSGGGNVRFRDIEAVVGTNFDDRMLAGNRGVLLSGAEGDDTLIGGAGNDTMSGDGGFDHPPGGPGNDRLFGGRGNDLLAGDSGNDTLDGGAGNDRLAGGEVGGGTADDDLLRGGTGNDTLTGTDGHDTLIGGSGADTFEFTQAGAANAQTVRDFASGVDRLAFESGGFALGALGNFAADDPRFHAADGATAAHDADDRLVYDTASGDLYYDADGIDGAAAVIVATFSGAPAIAAGDIMFQA